MEVITWVGRHIEIFIKSIISFVLLILTIKTWKACEDEIKTQNAIFKNQYKIFIDNIQKANEYCEKFCKIDLTGIMNTTILETKIKDYNLSIKDYQEKFLNTLKEQDEKIASRQDKLFELRKNEWKSIVPFLSVLALMWLGIKF